MATDLDNLKTRRTAICVELAAMATTTAGGLPNSQAAGVDHVGYRDSLYRELEILDRAIAVAEGPFEIETEAMSG